MFLVVELFFIVLLSMILFMIYKNERMLSKKVTPQAKIEECWSGKERRQYVRFKKALEVAYGVEKRPHLKNNGRTANISEGGMKLLMDEKLPKGTILNLELELPDPKKTIKIEGEVVWSDEAEKAEGSDKRLFHSGIKLLAIKGPFPTDFISYIRSLTKDIEV